jgi:hypothetical protein
MEEMDAMMRMHSCTGVVAAEQVHAKTHNFFVNRITDPIELSIPIKDVHQVAVEERKWNHKLKYRWNETRTGGHGDAMIDG